MSKQKFYEFNPQVYPTRLWIAKSKNISIDDVDEEFYALSDTNERCRFKEVQEMPDMSSYASTYPVSHKKTGWRGCLVILNRGDMPTSTCTHEASHCTDWLFEQLGIESGTTFDNGEARAYYHEWVFNRIYEVKQGRVR